MIKIIKNKQKKGLKKSNINKKKIIINKIL